MDPSSGEDEGEEEPAVESAAAREIKTDEGVAGGSIIIDFFSIDRAPEEEINYSLEVVRTSSAVLEVPAAYDQIYYRRPPPRNLAYDCRAHPERPSIVIEP